MKVFISWSGSRSKIIAEALSDWLPSVLQNVEPWISSSDIDAGMRWNPALSEQLKQTHLGIICLTAENLSAPWILFEAGALSKIIDKTRVCPYLFELEPAEITGPLSQFQAVKADNEGTKKLVQAINHAQEEHALPEDRLNRSFEAFWSSLENILSSIPTSPQGTPETKRSTENMVEEILNIVREQSRILSNNIDQTSVAQEYSLDLDNEILQAAKAVKTILRTFDLEVSIIKIYRRLRTLTIDFKVPMTEAIKSVANYYLEKSGWDVKTTPAESASCLTETKTEALDRVRKV